MNNFGRAQSAPDIITSQTLNFSFFIYTKYDLIQEIIKCPNLS